MPDSSEPPKAMTHEDLLSSVSDCLSFSPAFSLSGFETVNDSVLKEMHERAQNTLHNQALPRKPEFNPSKLDKFHKINKTPPNSRFTAAHTRDFDQHPSIGETKRISSGEESPSKRRRNQQGQSVGILPKLASLSLDDRTQIAKMKLARQRREQQLSPQKRREHQKEKVRLGTIPKLDIPSIPNFSNNEPEKPQILKGPLQPKTTSPKPILRSPSIGSVKTSTSSRTISRISSQPPPQSHLNPNSNPNSSQAGFGKRTPGLTPASAAVRPARPAATGHIKGSNPISTAGATGTRNQTPKSPSTRTLPRTPTPHLPPNPPNTSSPSLSRTLSSPNQNPTLTSSSSTRSLHSSTSTNRTVSSPVQLTRSSTSKSLNRPPANRRPLPTLPSFSQNNLPHYAQPTLASQRRFEATQQERQEREERKRK